MEGGERHLRRWSAAGRGPTRVIAIEPGSSELDRIVAEVAAAAAELLDIRRRESAAGA
jgi:hypothetical protein